MRISDWSSDVCSSDLGPVPRTPRCAVRNRSRDQRSAAEAEEGQEEAGGGESDRQAEDDLDQAPEAAGRLAKCEGQAGDDDDYHRDDLCDRSQIGRASGRERGGQYVKISGVAGTIK